MKKIVCYALNAAFALSLCACANSDGTISRSDTESGTPFVEVSDPFSGKNPEETESGGTDTEEDDGFNHLREMDPEVFTEDYIDFEKHNRAITYTGNIQVKANGEIYEDGPVTYRGGELEISFTMTPDTPADDHSSGYLVFIGDTPQILSLNGSEPSTMAIIEGRNGEPKECTIRFTPRLTKENLANEGDLALTLILMNNPLYLTFGTVAHFDFHQRIYSTFTHIPFKLEGDCEIVEPVSGKAFENFVGRDSEVRKYLDAMRLSAFENDGGGVYFELCSATTAKPVIQDGKADITLLLYGGKPTTAVPYKVYFYVNHELVKIDGCDYITAEWKEGLVAKYSTTIDNLKADDIVYAIAIAENARNMPAGYYGEGVIKTDTKRLLAAD